MFLTYDVTREETFVNLVQWLLEVKQHAAEDVRVYMIGNKAELEDQREVTLERAEEMARQHKIHRVFETSAKTGFNVEEVFSLVARELYVQAKESVVKPTYPDPPNPTVVIGQTPEEKGDKATKKKKSSCC